MLWLKIACEAGVLQHVTPNMKREIDAWIRRNKRGLQNIPLEDWI
jgi:hypothetical protein